MRDEFFHKTKCDRCGGSIADGFTMSKFDTSALCHKCLAEEQAHPDYPKAAAAELVANSRQFGAAPLTAVSFSPMRHLGDA